MNTQDQKNTKKETHSTNQRTETFQPASAVQDQMPQQDDAQQPTHDALSDIYNRGYSA